MTSDPGSFARSTIIDRKPKIISQVIEENNYPPEIIASLGEFREEIAKFPIQPLKEQHHDEAYWNEELNKYSGRTWLEVPWYFAESFFYRRMLEAVEYFRHGPWMFWNPFHYQKERQMKSDVKRFLGTWQHIFSLEPSKTFDVLLHSTLWGNRADLSNYTVDEKDRHNWSTESEKQNILINDTDMIRNLLSKRTNRIDFINDNAGSDILFDLALSHFLITQGWTKQVVFHLKNQPFFVSDAMPEDVRRLIEILQEECNSDDADNQFNSKILGLNIQDHINSGQFIIKEDPFWTSPFMFNQMPEILRKDLQKSDLVFLKGDVNYRRLLSDLHWPFTTRMEDLTKYFPASFVAIRTLKGEIMIGLESGQAEYLDSEDPAWLINGKRGLIQYIHCSDKP